MHPSAAQSAAYFKLYAASLHSWRPSASAGANARTRHGQPGRRRWCRFYSVVFATYSVAYYAIFCWAGGQLSMYIGGLKRFCIRFAPCDSLARQIDL
jgi:hypothetical protein